MNLFFSIILLLIIFYLINKVHKKFKLSTVVVLIITGLIIGHQKFSNLIITPNESTMIILGDIGLICLMFLAGLESSSRTLKKEGHDAIYLATFGFFIPLIIGISVFYLMGYTFSVALIVGISFSITAEGTPARVLMELKKLRTKVGAALMGAGIIDDILGLILFNLLTAFSKTNYVQEDMLLAGAIISFFIGVTIPTKLIREHKILKKIETLLLWGIVPFFFISMGLHFDIKSLILSPLLAIIILLLAIPTKVLAAILSKPFTKFNYKQLHLIGWAMNSRGAIGIAIVLIAYRAGLITVQLYSALIIMTLITTLIFPTIITKMIKQNPKIMN